MSDERAGFAPVRRVVTGHDQSQVAKPILDGVAENRRSSRPEVSSTLIWSSDRMPADIRIGESIEDMGARKLPTQPPPNGTRFIVMEFLPGASGQMHRTETIDYIAVLEGEIEMDMDASTVRLKAGDVMVQRGTNHAWKNRSARKARLAVVLVDAQPLGIGSPRKT
jgi:quercetin dioxygenase-like cupin family protein